MIINDHLFHKYDLVSVPAYARINLAQLRLYATSGDTATADWRWF